MFIFNCIKLLILEPLSSLNIVLRSFAFVILIVTNQTIVTDCNIYGIWAKWFGCVVTGGVRSLVHTSNRALFFSFRNFIRWNRLSGVSISFLRIVSTWAWLVFSFVRKRLSDGTKLCSFGISIKALIYSFIGASSNSWSFFSLNLSDALIFVKIALKWTIFI